MRLLWPHSQSTAKSASPFATIRAFKASGHRRCPLSETSAPRPLRNSLVVSIEKLTSCYPTGPEAQITPKSRRCVPDTAYLQRLITDLLLVLDNYAIHKLPEMQTWLAKRPRFKPYFKPTSVSRLNLVERFSPQSHANASGTAVTPSVDDLDTGIVLRSQKQPYGQDGDERSAGSLMLPACVTGRGSHLRERRAMCLCFLSNL